VCESRSVHEASTAREARSSAVRVRRRVREPAVVSSISAVSLKSRATWPTAQRSRRDGARAGTGEAWVVTSEGCASGRTTASAFHAGRTFAPGGGGGGIGIVGAVGAGGDGVADGVSDDVVVAVLVGGEDDQLGYSMSEVGK
jgi:hypothetical protein